MKDKLGSCASKRPAAAGHLVCAPEDSAPEATGAIYVAQRRRCHVQLARNEPELRARVCDVPWPLPPPVCQSSLARALKPV